MTFQQQTSKYFVPDIIPIMGEYVREWFTYNSQISNKIQMELGNDSYKLIQRLHNELDDLFGIRTMPERFLYILHHFSSNKLPVMCSEKDAYTGDFCNEWEPLGSIGSASTSCICSHWIDDNIQILNVINDNILTVGSECINKIVEKDLNSIFSRKMKQFLSRWKYLKNKESGGFANKQCKICYRNVIQSHIQSNICGRCQGENPGKSEYDYPSLIVPWGRNCGLCKRCTIEEQEDKSVEFCRDCQYKEEMKSRINYQCEVCLKYIVERKRSDHNGKCSTCKNKELCSRCKQYSENTHQHLGRRVCNRCHTHNGRECVDCHKYNIPNTEEKWKTRCKPCYILFISHKTNTFYVEDKRQCEGCYQYRIPQDKPFKLCYNCYKNSKA